MSKAVGKNTPHKPKKTTSTPSGSGSPAPSSIGALAGVAAGAVGSDTKKKVELYTTLLFFGIMAVWLFVVLVGYAYMVRGLGDPNASRERKRLSIGFTLASVFFPPFMTVPVTLNAM